jgi:hypothetical protein
MSRTGLRSRTSTSRSRAPYPSATSLRRSRHSCTCAGAGLLATDRPARTAHLSGRAGSGAARWECGARQTVAPTLPLAVRAIVLPLAFENAAAPATPRWSAAPRTGTVCVRECACAASVRCIECHHAIAHHCVPTAAPACEASRGNPHPFEKRYVPRPCFLLHTHCPSYTSPLVYSHLEQSLCGNERRGATGAEVRGRFVAAVGERRKNGRPLTGQCHGGHRSSTGPRTRCRSHMCTCTCMGRGSLPTLFARPTLASHSEVRTGIYGSSLPRHERR